MEPSIIRQGELVGRGEDYLGTAHALPGGLRGQAELQRGEIWRDAPGICDLTSAQCKSLSEGKRRFLRALSLPLKSKSVTCRAQRVSEQHGAQ